MIWPEAHLPASELPRGQTSVPPINSAGYRGREPLDLGEVNILFIGDEWTEGSNINYENSFAAIVAKKLSLKTGKRIHEFNLGQEGKSYDYVSRILMCSLELMKPEFVLICFPPMGRREYFALDGRLIDFDPIKAAAIIGVKPWGQQRVPLIVQNNASEMVGWNTSTIISAIRRNSI